ncbi:MAG: bifunctional folylpolyglutamate synthase/dihydrofolate synthase [Rhodospirillales bacterium]|nr:bifunctional folylpolyglutamate synthase/dihydrofolate synthase [Rhodospirillales bacterium]
MNPDPILARLTALHPKAIDLSLDRVRRLMADLGDPQNRLPPVIHVAGTNGKGSVVAYLRAMAEAAGYRTHVYISPHLVRFNERIRLAGALIEDEPLAALLEEVERINAGRPVTFFEITTAAAFLAFARHPADLVLLETGMGGRLDATNLVARPAATAITSISFDHMQHLGDTLAIIAGEKAGILKRHVPAAIGPQPPEAAAAIDRRAAGIDAPLFRHGREWRSAPGPEGMRYEGLRRLDLPLPALAGRHQIDNAGVAIAVSEHLPGFRIEDGHRREGLQRVEWPARLQRLTKGPLVELLPPGVELYLDGGHNESAAEILADWARGLDDGRSLDLVFGMLTTKSPEKFLAHLRPHIRRVRTLVIPNEPLSFAAEPLATAARAAGIADTAPSAGLGAALADLVRIAGDRPPRVLICGSLHLAGVVLAENG